MHQFHRKFGFFLLVLVLIMQPGCQSGVDAPHFRFVFMTDIHVQPERGATAGFEQAIQTVNSLNPKPDFVITGGDLIMDALGQSYRRADSLYKLYRQLTDKFDMPVYNTIGNHEIFGLYPTSMVDPDHPEYGKTMFKNRLGNGATYRSFDHKGWHFVLLDGIGITPERTYEGKMDTEQIEWLKNDLAGVDRKTPVVFSTHIPFFSVYNQYRKGPTTANGSGSVVQNAHEIVKACESNALKLVLQGHLHIIEDIELKGVHYVTGGAVSAAWWKGANEGFPEGFVVVDVSGDKFEWHYQTFGWDASKYIDLN